MIVFVPILVVVAVAAAVLARSPGARRLAQRFEDPGRIRLLTMAIIVWTAGIVLFDPLTFDDNDNAYLWLALLGLVMVPFGFAFLLEAALPAGPLRRWGAFAVLLAFWSAGVLGVAGLAWALIEIPSQDYPDNDVFVAHLLGLCLLTSVLGAALLIFRPTPRR